MKKFRVFLRGQNFFLRVDEKVQRCGFYVTRFVQAEDEAEAERQAVALLRKDGKLKGLVLNDPGDPPMLFAEEIEETESFDDLESLEPGFTFFPEDATEH